jgi:hypothetical protein
MCRQSGVRIFPVTAYVRGNLFAPTIDPEYTACVNDLYLCSDISEGYAVIVQVDFLKNIGQMSLEEKRGFVCPSYNKMSIYRQCKIMELPLSNYYFKANGESMFNLHVMNAIYRKFLDCPFYGVDTDCLIEICSIVPHTRDILNAPPYLTVEKITNLAPVIDD